MEFYTDQNDLNKLDRFTPPKGSNKDKGNAGILDIFVASILKIQNLAKISVDNSSKFIGYVIFMALLVSLMSFAVPTASRIYSFGGFSKLFRESIPTFKVSDGVLTADKKFEMSLSNADILIDTSKSEFQQRDFEETGVYIAFGSRNVKMVNFIKTDSSTSYNELYSYPIKMVIPNGVDNSILEKMAPFFYASMVFVYLIQAVISSVKYIFMALMFALFSRSTTAISKLDMTFKDSVHFCFYCQTIAILLVTANLAIGEIIPGLFMSIIGIVITVVVIMKAIKPHLPDIDEYLDKFGGSDKFDMFK
ncbi:MAG: DUF1189 family protein [Eubacterium sp.]|nr:DUF1189 family protein [Eubacterium sp.]